MAVDYNDKNYDYISYWATRSYEHNCEIIALKKLLPKCGKSIIDIGGGFGRLLPVYKDRFGEITVLDASSKILEEAKKQASNLKISNIAFRVGKIPLSEELDFKSSRFDCALMVRVSHHLTDLDTAIKSISKVISDDGVFVLEFANKLHFLNIFRNLSHLNCQVFSKDPYKLGTFTLWHPKHVEGVLKKYGFMVEEKLSISNFRIPFVKKVVPEKALLVLENFLQKPLSYINFGPSIFVKAVKNTD